MASTLFSANLSSAADGRESLLEQYRQVRRQTETICQPLATEDYCIQTMPDVSPPKWHIAHVSWFFETFLLLPFDPDYRLFHPRFDYSFQLLLCHPQPALSPATARTVVTAHRGGDLPLPGLCGRGHDSSS